MKKIILASGSPRRQELLKGLDLDFEVRLKNGIEESYPDDLPAVKVPEYISKEKAAAYKVGEEMVFTFRLEELEADVNKADYSIKWDLWTDDGQTQNDKIALTTDAIVVKTTLSKPGFVRLVASVVDKKNRKVKREKARNKNDTTVEFFGGAAAEPE